MSSTDGEDTKQFDETLLNTPESIEESGYISKGKKISQSAYKLVQKNKSLEQDLASLREQLKQQEEVIRELTEVLSHYFDLGYIHGMGYTGKHRIESILEKAKSLTTKDK